MQNLKCYRCRWLDVMYGLQQAWIWLEYISKNMVSKERDLLVGNPALLRIQLESNLLDTGKGLL